MKDVSVNAPRSMIKVVIYDPSGWSDSFERSYFLSVLHILTNQVWHQERFHHLRPSLTWNMNMNENMSLWKRQCISESLIFMFHINMWCSFFPSDLVVQCGSVSHVISIGKKSSKGKPSSTPREEKRPLTPCWCQRLHPFESSLRTKNGWEKMWK